MYRALNVLALHLSFIYINPIKNTQVRSVPKSLHGPTSEALHLAKATCIFTDINYLLTSCTWVTFSFSLHSF